jgi:magnesium transporter
MKIIGEKVRWIDITMPNQQDIRFLKSNFQIHPIILEELLGPSARSKVEVFNTYLYLVYFFPAYNKKERSSYQSEVDFVITKNEVITVHYEDFAPLDEFRRQLENEHFREKVFDQTYHLAYYLLESFITYFEREQHHISEKIEEISQELFKNKEEELLKEISYVKRDIANYSIIVHLQESVLKSLASKTMSFWPEHEKTVQIFFDDLVSDQLRVLNQINNIREIVNGLEETNSQLLTSKTNSVMKTFTIMAFLTFPLMLIAAIFSMRTDFTPIIGVPGDFWIILGVMAVAMIAMFAFFKNKNWL